MIALVDDLAAQLKAVGLRPGDRVALRAGSNAEFVVGLLAASRADLVVVPLDPALPVAEQRARSEAAGARVVLVDEPRDADSDEAAPPWWPIAVAVGPDGTGPAVSLDSRRRPEATCRHPRGCATTTP